MANGESTTRRAPLNAFVGLPLSAALGITLAGTALVAPAAADTASPKPPTPPTAVITPTEESVREGAKVGAELLVTNPNADELCVRGGLSASQGIKGASFQADQKAPGDTGTAELSVSGTAAKAGSVEFTADVEYAPVADGACGAFQPLTVDPAATEVTPKPEPSDPPPSSTPPPSPSKPPSSKPPSSKPPSSKPPESSSPGKGGGKDDKDESGKGGGGRSDRGDRPRPSADRFTPPGDTSLRDSEADRPSLPDDLADLPGVDPGTEDDLAALPSVTPGDGDSGKETATNVSDDNAAPAVSPSVLLLFLLLLALFSAPLAPMRRVRTGGVYKGRRRRPWWRPGPAE